MLLLKAGLKYAHSFNRVAEWKDRKEYIVSLVAAVVYHLVSCPELSFGLSLALSIDRNLCDSLPLVSYYFFACISLSDIRE